VFSGPVNSQCFFVISVVLNISQAGCEYCMMDSCPVPTGPRCSAGDWVCQESAEIKPEVNKCYLCLLVRLTTCRGHGRSGLFTKQREFNFSEFRWLRSL